MGVVSKDKTHSFNRNEVGAHLLLSRHFKRFASSCSETEGANGATDEVLPNRLRHEINWAVSELVPFGV